MFEGSIWYINNNVPFNILSGQEDSKMESNYAANLEVKFFL